MGMYSQLYAIGYAVTERNRKLRAIEKMGLMEEYEKFCKGYNHHRIAAFCKEKGIDLEIEKKKKWER